MPPRVHTKSTYRVKKGQYVKVDGQRFDEGQTVAFKGHHDVERLLRKGVIEREGSR